MGRDECHDQLQLYGRVMRHADGDPVQVQKGRRRVQRLAKPDAESADGWTEIDAPGEDAPEVIAAVDEAIRILKGGASAPADAGD